ncbi:MAG: hypothetical protein QM702_25200 [Rubrivivax sp.]
MLSQAEVAHRIAAIRRLPQHEMRDALDAWARELKQCPPPVMLRRVGGGFCVGALLDDAPALVADSPAMRAVHAAVSQPGQAVRLADLMPGAPATTARSRVARAVDELASVCPGLRDALMPTRSRDGGLAVLNAGPALVYRRRRGAPLVMASGSFV